MQLVPMFQALLWLAVSTALMAPPTLSSAVDTVDEPKVRVHYNANPNATTTMTNQSLGVYNNTESGGGYGYDYDYDYDFELGSASCAGLSDCYNCTNTYTCHWCSFDEQCHARGSVHGCAWGVKTCDAQPTPPHDENTTCSSHATCSECALSSHFCHWCEHDNACHAIGSRYGCTTGVDCYSNDRCRREEPEPFHRFILLEAPKVAVVLILIVGTLLVACLSCCHFCVFNVKGAYDDLATTMSMAASRPPSVIGGTLMMMGTEPLSEHFYNTLETTPEEEEETVHANNTNRNNAEQGEAVASANTTGTDEEAPTPATTATIAGPKGTSSSPATTGPEDEEDQQQRPLELESDPNDLLNDHDDDAGPTTPLLHHSSARSFRGIPGMEEPRHMKALYRMCSCLYYLSVLLVLSLVFVSLFFFPKPPVYNVCNDAVAWKNIIEEMVALKLDASFEILVSVSNPNHLTVVLEKASGSFSFDGQPIGTYEMPAETVEGMAITDMMLIAKVTPDKYQIVQLAEAYYRGNLVLKADFNAKLRAPALFDVTYEVHMKHIDVFVNELGPRDLCHCPSWDESSSSATATSLVFFN